MRRRTKPTASMTGAELLSSSSTIVPSKDQVSCDLGREVLILNLKTGAYYGLTEVGARVWNLIQKPRTVQNVRQILLEEYEVDGNPCDQDLEVLLKEMESCGLIEIG